jgi:YVTN family beta-propeller protein
MTRSASRLAVSLATVALTWLALGAGAAAATNLYAADQNEATVFQYGVGASGLLSALSPAFVTSSAGATQLAVSPDGKSIYVANKGKEVSQYNIGAGGLLMPMSPPTVPAGTDAYGIAVAPDGKSVYVANQLSETVSQYDVGPGGALSPKSPATVKTGEHPNGIAISPDGKSVYVASGGSKDIWEYDVGSGGALSPKPVTPAPAGEEAWGIVVSPDGRSVYVTDYEDNGVFQYDVGPGGALSPKSPSLVATGEFPLQIAISPDGKSLYVTNDGAPEAEAISQYDVGGDGLLSPKAVPLVAAPRFGADAVVLTPDGRSAYLGVEGGAIVAQYDVGPGGALSAKVPASVPAGSEATGLAVTPDQAPAASFTSSVLAAGSASAFNASASTDPDGTVASYSWSFGDGSIGTGVAPAHTYAAPGTYTVTLQVADEAGCSAALVFTGQTAYCNESAGAIASALVTIPPGSGSSLPLPVPAPTITSARQSATRWREGHRTAAISRRRLPVGTTFSFTLNERAGVRFKFTHLVGGRRDRGRCVAQTKRNRRRHACRRTVAAGSLSFAAHSGRNKVAFQGRLSAGHKLLPGRYTLVITATNSTGARSAPASLSFTIVR